MSRYLSHLQKAYMSYTTISFTSSIPIQKSIDSDTNREGTKLASHSVPSMFP
ncbi:Hypothetical predicted protein, partial [Pelobates cultripes]